MVSSTSVPDPGAERTVARAAVALHPADDRLADAAAVRRDATGVEPATPVADVDLGSARAELGVDGNRPALTGELGGVRERFAGRRDQGLGRGSRARGRRP